MPQTIFEWQGKQYDSEEKTGDWYWALGIVAVAGAIACILFKNILLALVIIAASATVGLQAAKRPRIHRFAVTDVGIRIDDELYPYDNMLHFSVLEYIDPTIPPALSIKTKSPFAPHLLIPIVGYDPVDVYEYIAHHLEEGKHDESVIDRLTSLLRL
jgi:hypothetical protein